MIYAIPAVLGLLIKLAILYFAKSSKKSRTFILFITLISIHNMSELFLFYQIFNKADPTLALRLYYACILGALAGMCVYATHVSNSDWHNKAVKSITVIFSIVCITVMLSPLIINGYEPLGQLVTAIKGDYYFVFQVSSVFAVFFTLFILIKSCVFAKNTPQKMRSAYVLASLVPPMIIGISVLVLMNLGVEINAMTIFPIGTTLLVLITLKAENKHNLTDIRMYLPFSKERQTSQDLIKIMSDYSVSEKDYKETVRDIERILFNYSYEKSNYCKSTTAKKLNVSRSTLYGMIHRLDLKK